MSKILYLTWASLSFISVGIYFLYTLPKTNTKFSFVWDEQDYCEYDYSQDFSVLDDEQANFLKEQSYKFLAILKNQSLHEIFKNYKINNEEILALTKALSPYIRARDIAVGDFYNFELASSQIKSFMIKKPDPNRLPITYIATRKSLGFNKPEFVLTISAPQVTQKLELVTITIKDTLFKSLANLPFGNELMQGALNILAWRMRLPEQVAKNDTMQILVKTNYADNKFLGYGRIEALVYTQAHQIINAYYFSSQDKKIEGYYDERGISLEKEFLVSPVHHSVATSNQQQRFHPVYKTRMRHNGTDFRGTIGTDFFSIGDGEIIEKRFDKNVGYMIRIRHKYGVHSEYFHADSLVENLVVGSRVRRGQKIGEIGRTGLLCTGPHLHMGLYKLIGETRKYIELASLKKQLADQPHLNDKYRAEFSKITNEALVQASLFNKFEKSGEILEN